MPKLKFEKLEVDSTFSARVSRVKGPGDYHLKFRGDSPSIPTHSTSGTGALSRMNVQRVLLPRLGPVNHVGYASRYRSPATGVCEQPAFVHPAK